MQTSGLLLDVYDDHDGAALRALWPSEHLIPDGVKTATPVTGELHHKLPDDAFALVLLNGTDKLRKYACIDEGNTILSVEYFLKNAHKLPQEAQAVTAENLKVACSWYDIEVPGALEKLALGIGTLLTAATTIPGTAQNIKENLGAVRAGEQGSFIRPVITPGQRNEMLGRKVADINGTDLSTIQVPTTFKKTVAMPPKTAHMNPVVDVTGMYATKTASAREVTHYAVPSLGKYPLDNYAQVKTASAYFDEYVKHMEPEMRREFASHMVKRANELAIEVSEIASRYGSSTYADDTEMKIAFDLRRQEVHGDPELFKLLGEVEKVARHRIWKDGEKMASVGSPEQVIALLGEFDKLAGIDRHYDRAIPDPYYSILGAEKTAESNWSDIIGNDYIDEPMLRRLAMNSNERLIDRFGDDLQKEFVKDPVGVYKSLPLDQKRVLIHMAESAAPGEPI